MPTVCQASLEPRKLKLNLGSSGPKGDAAPSRCRIWRCNSTCKREMQLSAGEAQLQFLMHLEMQLHLWYLPLPNERYNSPP